MHEAAEVQIDEITQTTNLFTHTNEIPYLACWQQDHPGWIPQRQWRSTAACPPTIISALTPGRRLGYSVQASATPRVDASDAAFLVSTETHPEVCLKAEYYTLFGVYQDWVQQNPGNHLYGGIKEDSKWQDMWRNLSIC